MQETEVASRSLAVRNAIPQHQQRSRPRYTPSILGSSVVLENSLGRPSLSPKNVDWPKIVLLHSQIGPNILDIFTTYVP